VELSNNINNKKAPSALHARVLAAAAASGLFRGVFPVVLIVVIGFVERIPRALPERGNSSDFHVIFVVKNNFIE
jgi:hypothetical protein